MPNTCSVNLQLKKYEGSTGNGFNKVIIKCMYSTCSKQLKDCNSVVDKSTNAAGIKMKTNNP